ncbi:OmpA family protein [Tardiphaga sp.]|jgi:outer membrane protein OmpA-like peptidoglycan-associated protein|uniref:OmpA family protein n=1 Tax=Tardiphaga sp. TaxID=1926292 RepID=UPI0037D9D7E9
MLSIFKLYIKACRSAPLLLVTACIAVALISSAAVGQARPPVRASAQEFNWTQTASLEHEDRKNRFRRLATQGLLASPQFYEALVDRRYLRAFDVDLPVLRLVFGQQVFFDTDKSELRPEALPVLNVVAESLRKDVPDVALFIAGHADGRGSDEYNYPLSVARADTVARYLFSRGIGVARLWRVGFGKTVPVRPNTTSENMAANRRVEFLFAARPEAVAVWLAQQASVANASPVVATPVLSENPPAPVGDRSASAEVAAARTIAPIGTKIANAPVNEEAGKAPVNSELSKATVSSGLAKATINSELGKAPANSELGKASVASAAQVVKIEANSPVIIDLKEQRVSVGAPIL